MAPVPRIVNRKKDFLLAWPAIAVRCCRRRIAYLSNRRKTRDGGDIYRSNERFFFFFFLTPNSLSRGHSKEKGDLSWIDKSICNLRITVYRLLLLLQDESESTVNN